MPTRNITVKVNIPKGTSQTAVKKIKAAARKAVMAKKQQQARKRKKAPKRNSRGHMLAGSR